MDKETRQQIFLLSPARVDGVRAQIVMRDAATFELAKRLRQNGAPLGEVFSFTSGLYFRGKLAYSAFFAAPPVPGAGTWIITSRGLVTPETIVTRADLQILGAVPIDHEDARYTRALKRDCADLLQRVGPQCAIVLLGSVASPKYVEPLLEVFGPRIVFPADFIGRGDLSRGGLLLRAVQSKTELPYIPIAGAIRTGARPARLTS
jgi:hypothetical protein